MSEQYDDNETLDWSRELFGSMADYAVDYDYEMVIDDDLDEQGV